MSCGHVKIREEKNDGESQIYEKNKGPKTVMTVCK